MNQDLATIIRLTKLTETSLIVTWITENHGLVKTVAKGARRPKSSFAGKIDLFYTATACWTDSKQSELLPLREVTPSNYRQDLRKSYKNTELAAYFCTLMESVMEPNMPADGFLDLLNRGLDYLCSDSASLKALLHFEKELCKIIGIFHQQKQPHLLIETAFGRLPRNRDRCITLLQD